jgi:hypothetical protein
MNLKRAAWMGVLSYALSFFLGIAGALLLGVDLTTAVEPTTGLWVYGIIVTAVIMALFAVWYFKSVTPSPKEGLYFGLVAVGVGFLVDALIIIPSMIFSDAPQDILSYYANPLLWVTIVVLLGTTALVGYWKGKK